MFTIVNRFSLAFFKMDICKQCRVRTKFAASAWGLHCRHKISNISVKCDKYK